MPQAKIFGRLTQRLLDRRQHFWRLRRIEQRYGLAQDRFGVARLDRIRGHGSTENPTPAAPMAADTATRSASLSAGGHKSSIKTTRSWSLSFHASCSIVSSNTKA